MRALLVPEARFDDLEALLSEMFHSDDPVEEFRSLPSARTLPSPWETPIPTDAFWQDKKEWLRDLWRHCERLPQPSARLPYWSQRNKSNSRKSLDLAQTKRRYVDMLTTLESAGYLANAFGEDCVDDPEPPRGTLGSDAGAAIEAMVGKPDLWHPFDKYRFYSEEDFFDVIELVADLVARPRRRTYHSWNQCGWHHSLFAREPGLRLYRHLLNGLLADSELQLTLGPRGRLEHTSDRHDEGLVQEVRAGRSDEDPVEVAVEQFRQRGAKEETKRGAIVTLAGVLEGRRALLKAWMLKRDEGALFQIANEFDLRHRKVDQKSDYDKDLYFEWLFHWYLSTIRLSDGILQRSSGEQVTSQLADLPPF